MEELITVLIGMLTGFSSGMFGIGGSIVATPFIKLFLGLAAKMAVATPLPAAIPAAATGTINYHKKGLINYKLAGLSLITAIPFGILASYLTNFVDGTVLIIGKALFLMFLGLKFFISSWLFKSKEEEVSIQLYSALLAGALAGFVAGIIAVGGGIVMVTAYVRINKLPMKNAVATSLLNVGILALINSIVHISNGNVDFKTMGIIALVVIPFSYLGSKLAISLRNKTLERIFGVVMIVFAIYFIILQLLGI